jgi:hypothetical protein
VTRRAACLALILLAASISCTGRDARPVPGDLLVRIQTDPEALLGQAHPAPPDNRARHARLEKLFAEAGCRARTEVTTGDLICRVEGQTDDWIVVGASYDEPPRPVDSHDWPSAALLPALVRSLRLERRTHSFAFVAFADQRHRRPGYGTPGGVRYFIERLPSDLQRKSVAMISLSGFGPGFGHAPIGVWSAQADPDMRLDVISVSKSLDLPSRNVELKKYHASDLTQIFEPAIPSIFLFVADPEIGGLAGEYVDSFRFLAVYLGYVDHTLEARSKPTPLEDVAQDVPPSSAVSLGAGEGADDEGQGTDGTGEEDVREH